MKNFKLEYIYLIWTPAYPLFIKVGISQNPHNRARQISESLRRKSRVYVLISNQMYFAYMWEQTFHAIFFFLNCRMFIDRKVSGRTEFFLFPLLPVAIFYILLPKLLNLIAIMLLLYIFFN